MSKKFLVNMMMKLVKTHAVVLSLATAMAGVSGMAFADVTVGAPTTYVPITDDADQFITATSENDKYFGNADRHYTNGAQLNYTLMQNAPNGWEQWLGEHVPLLDVGGRTATSYSVGQQIYTPDHAERPFAQPGDQPFSGFLYAKAGFTTYQPDHTDSYELTGGIVGPSAQGEFVQKTYHEALDYYKPAGWDYYQLNDEPILNFSYVRSHPGIVAWQDTFMGKDWFADATPHYGFAVGNAYDYANAGGVVRFGPASARSAEVPNMTVPGQPGGAYFAKGPNWFDWYVFAGLDTRAVARDIFLDGNSFQDSPHVEKEVLVGNATAGVVLLTGKVKSSFTLNQESKMYKSQANNDVYGSINVGYRF